MEFEGYGKGNITDCQIPKIENGIRKGIGFVALWTVDEAKTAENAMDGLEVKGTKTTIQFVKEAGKGKGNIIRNISQQCTKDDLRQAIKPFGSTNHYIFLDEKGENTDTGSVSFKTVQEAVEAKRKLDGTKVDF